MVIAAFSVTDQADRVGFLKETFLVANISLDMVLTILFLTFSDTNIDFLKRKL